MKNKIWILGPCSMQDENFFLSTTETINDIAKQNGLDEWYMKASFDKANRTSIVGGRGPGLDTAIEIWKKAKEKFPSVQFITDVHECWQVEKLVGVVDVIQIPAFLGRQTDLIVESAKHFNKINIKKGQWLGPNNLRVSVDKVKDTNPNCEAWICDRGSNFGYHDLFVNFGIVDELKKSYDRVIIDCTHSTQRSREVYGVQGDPVLAERYFLSADIFNYDGVFAEVHPNPETSPSDGQCMIELNKLDQLIKKSNQLESIVK